MLNRHKNWLVHKQTAFGKDFSNPFMVDNLPKIVWFSTFLASPEGNRLATPGQMATGKESLNPFMAGSLPKTISSMIHLSQKMQKSIRFQRILSNKGGWKKQNMHERSMTNFKEAKDSKVCKITRADGSSSFHGDIQALLRRLDRQDLSKLYSLVQERFKDHPLEDGTSIQINMLVEKKYPLKKAILEKMINLMLEAEEESTMAHELLKFIKSHIEEHS
ncbi:hypothetical protein Tco_0651736 [Tanacetum coccineum]|uniref:Uncharacterized protein n=1 Tax=Tanacetum coccineum TaxID=301880 RepID=A0ABQ4WVM9_9ASTR